MSVYIDEFKKMYSQTGSLNTLREKILELAVTGKLSHQYPDAENASREVDSILSVRSELIKTKSIRKQANVLDVTDVDVISQFPENWFIGRIGSIGTVNGGKRVSKGYKLLTEPTNHVYIRVTDMKNNSINEDDLRYISDDEYANISRYTISSDDIYITIAGTIGSVGIVPEELNGMNLTENACKVVFYSKDSINQRYVMWAIQSPFVQKQFSELVNKMAQPKLAITRIYQTILPIPPKSEQSRIVNKIEDLMMQIDLLEEKLNKKEHLLELLPQTVVDAIGSCQTGEELKTQLEFVIDNFEEVFQTPESMQDLRKVILQLAIEGKLVDQDPSDGPASELLEKIKAERDQLVAEKKIKKPKKLEPITEDEMPFEIPESWEWVRLNEVTDINPRNQLDDSLVVSFIPMKLMEDGYGSSHKDESRQWKQLKKGYTHFAEQDIAVAKITPCFENRKSAILTDLKSGYGAGTTEFHIVRVYHEELQRRYLLNLFKTQWFIDRGVNTFSGTAGQQRVSTDFMKELLVPIPPAIEQIRIVEKTYALLSVIDALERKMKNKKRITELLGTA